MYIYYQNINRARSKIDSLYKNFLNSNYNLICLTETNFDASVYNGELFDEQYNVFRRDHDTTCIKKYNKDDGGGVLVAVKKQYSAVGQVSWESELEDVWISISPPNISGQTNNVCVCYLPPYLNKNDLSNFYSNLQNIILKSNEQNYFALFGDFNVPNVSWILSNDGSMTASCNEMDYKSELLLDTL
ncbi:unnamed protein product [Parnassius apollo]|uniref:(apollo) hypothetical protein n=1 Tax=Parnassius apollo TaxID=110799 RepID=A0A8S3XLH7_PARAO|nr:unnamed protein product [Parnassius apollo]